ncbi:hypothetical protein B0T21DRAFT_354342 [Apiosordaria backusii]|uniref:Uncharacterized protein n=1 Tax=Apiosordaria backusii TaxID=314023 RepID=A0AA40K6R6_9PEZI|nr:hypothetical protein B0T21DRAFT_354342 [Apiosordaria backusii]
MTTIFCGLAYLTFFTRLLFFVTISDIHASDWRNTDNSAIADVCRILSSFLCGFPSTTCPRMGRVMIFVQHHLCFSAKSLKTILQNTDHT